ncbi:Hypothetical_protein [Hexamita inflata]|uniref:Hypothetical_protein n=1 Tax=Hexamita inflata TaxID=28002 RepID=A0AA86NDT6_9EUKA|nr:Hypothetical protein HINF_LOCUS5158 [Hexamita inflata]
MVTIVQHCSSHLNIPSSEENSGVQLYEAKWPLYSKASAHGKPLRQIHSIFQQKCPQHLENSHFQRSRNNIKNKQGDRRPRENQMLAETLAQDQTNSKLALREGKQIPANFEYPAVVKQNGVPVQHTKHIPSQPSCPNQIYEALSHGKLRFQQRSNDTCLPSLDRMVRSVIPTQRLLLINSTLPHQYLREPPRLLTN